MRAGALVTVAALVGACVAVAAPARAQSADDRAVADYVRALQQAIRAGDSVAVGRMTRFTLDANWAHSTEHVRGRQQFLRRYRAVFDARIRRAVLAQNPDSLFHGSGGYMIGDGDVWLWRYCEKSDTACAHPRTAILAVNLGRP